MARLYRVKRRPADHPVIVHFADAERAFQWAREVPESAHALAEKFWPGPLTLILNRADHVGGFVTGGQDTVGVRVPAHPLAHELLVEFSGEEGGRRFSGVAAPSANRFGRVSPTTAQHVRDDLGEDVDFVLDGGPCGVGIESTIVDVSRGAPVSAWRTPGGPGIGSGWLSVRWVRATRVRLARSALCAEPARLANPALGAEIKGTAGYRGARVR
jgi:L-threonylcarbamoyladenylate synthase